MTQRSDNWPYETLEEIKCMTEAARKDWRNTKTVMAICATVILSVWIGLMFARGL